MRDVEMVSDHHLLPPERWFAEFILKRQRTHRTPAILRLEENYGPDGIALMAAALTSGLSGALIGCTGIVLLFLSGGRGAPLTAGYCLLVIGILLEIPAMVRAAQGVHAGRRFRGDRPFVRRP